MSSVPSLNKRESRSTRRIEGLVHRQDGRATRVLLTNLSSRGCRMQAADMPAIDELVRIEVPRVGSVAARVRWVSNGSAGAEFVPESDVWEEVPRNVA